ncbi:multidrug resistance-associated protein 5 [Tanacetum coccineum]|uniref:Multidrug resistance-associated protein 5 n=1 Tax=Tanacetum coccineum TaxID=301880 RepID=A0ABQ5IE94_9ASTR
MMRLLSMRNDRSNMKVEEESPQSVKMGVWESIHRRYRDGGAFLVEYLMNGKGGVGLAKLEHCLFGGLTLVCAAAWCGKVVIASGQGNADAKCDLEGDKIRERGFEQQWLSITFSKAVFLGNGLVAILAGLFGNILVGSLAMGPVAPFDATSIFLAIGRSVEGEAKWPKKRGATSDQDKGKAEDLQGESVAKKGKKKGTKKGVSGCTFRLWASLMQDGSCFQIKTLIPEHTCSRNFELGSLVTFKWIAKQFALKIIEDPTITYRSGLIEHYSRLWDYRKQLLDTNPGSSVHLHVDELDNGKIHFKRIYVCFKAMIEGWSAGCRKVIGLDGCFLKGTCRGELLTAMGRDGNNQMFPIAWAVVSVETIDNWEWFLACLCEDLRLDSGASLTVISDGHKGLMESVKNLLPHAEHRQCARHIYANFKKKWNGLHFKSLFWLAATTTIQHTFYSKMNLIGNIDPEAKQWLVDRNPNSWCRAFFKMDRGCAAYENGISESYHNSIRIARGKPLITMLEEIRVYLMQRLYSMHNLATNLVDSITPSIRKEIERLKHSQRYWTVYPCGDNVFEVRNGDDSYGVNIENRTCACKWWDLSGVPCVHAVAAFSFLKNDPILGVSAWYSKKMWQNAYSYFIKPVGGSSMWPQTPEEPPLPPVLRKMPGRPRKLRIKHVTERDNVITRSGRMMTCQNCWEKGHNKKSCKKEKQPKPTVEKRAPGRKKVGSNFVFQAGPSVADPSSAGPSVADPSSAGPSVADSTGSGTQAATVTDPTDEIPTQQSKTSDTAMIIEDVIATGRLKTAGLKRRCKSERIAKRAKAYQFGKDGAGSCSEKAWDVDEVLAEK